MMMGKNMFVGLEGQEVQTPLMLMMKAIQVLLVLV